MELPTEICILRRPLYPLQEILHKLPET